MAGNTEKPTDFDIDDLLQKLNHCLEAKDGNVNLKAYIEAYDELYKLFLALGTLFGFVAADVKEKCDLLRNLLQEIEHYETVEGMIAYEVTEDLTKTCNANGCRTLLRLHRAMPFVSKFLKRVHEAGEDDPLRKHGREAYDETLAKYHPWLIRKAVSLAVYSLPTRRNLLNIIAGESAEKHEYVANQAPIVVERLDMIFERVEALYDQHGLLELP